MFKWVVLTLTVLSSLFLILEVLLHSGKGGGLSDMFGGGGGLSGGTSVEKTLDRITVITAIIFGLSVVWLDKFWL
jgi:preprotein translocase subunit SecG